MATVTKKVAQLPVLGEPLRIGRIKAWSVRTNIAAGEIVRRALWGPGWDVIERQLQADYGGPLSENEELVGTLHALPAHLRREFAERHNLTAELGNTRYLPKTGRRAE